MWKHAICDKLSNKLQDKLMLNDNIDDEKKVDIIKTDKQLWGHSVAQIVKQITLMVYEIYSKIDSRECLAYGLRKDNYLFNCPNITKLLKQFNEMKIYTQMRILMEKKSKLRIKIIKWYINMAFAFKKLYNYHSVYSIIVALRSNPIQNLKKTWAQYVIVLYY